MRIRKVELSEIDQLQAIGKQTFFETFAKDNTEENMKEYLANGFSKEKLISEMQNEFSEFYFAFLEDQVIGYLKINFGPAQTENQGQDALEIERIYVLKEFHGKKVGQLLYDKAIDIAHSKNLQSVWLGVWEKNPRAIRFYEKNGFVEFDKHVFHLGDDVQTDILMRLTL